MLAQPCLSALDTLPTPHSASAERLEPRSYSLLQLSQQGQEWTRDPQRVTQASELKATLGRGWVFSTEDRVARAISSLCLLMCEQRKPESEETCTKKITTITPLQEKMKGRGQAPPLLPSHEPRLAPFPGDSLSELVPASCLGLAQAFRFEPV